VVCRTSRSVSILILVIMPHVARAQPADAGVEPLPDAPVAPPAGAPAAESPPPAPTAPTPPPTEPPSAETSGAGEVIEVEDTHRTVLPPPKAGASDFVLPRDRLTAAPHRDAGEMLAVAPGIYVGRGEGDAVGHEIFLRGFDAAHGQDIEISVAGIPLNQRSHIHGQGYTDLGFVIPELVRSIRVTEGVYDPRQGDFATAGSIAFDLGVEKRGLLAKVTFGSFGERRVLMLWAPEGSSDDTFAAVAMRETDGFGENRGSKSATAIGQREVKIGDSTGLFHAAFTGTRANIAGFLRADDIASGKVGYYDTYALPTANSQSGFNARAELGFRLLHKGDDGTRTETGVYAVYTAFRLRTNQTGFLDRSQINPDFYGRGDLFEQENRDFTLGANFTHRMKPYEAGRVHGYLELGTSSQLDVIDQAQNLLEAPQNETWDNRVDASIRQTDIGMWVDGHVWLGDKVRLRGGVRADALYFDVDDRLGNFIPVFRRQDYIIGFRRTAFGTVAGPRATLEYEPRRDLLLLASYGEGYRSPQARLLEEGETAPFAKVRGAEVGAQLGNDLGSHVTTSAYLTKLSLDLAFDPSTSTLERIGPTTRLGIVVNGVWRPRPWLFAAVAANVVRATLDAPPPPTAEVPDPPYKPGQLLPYVPPVVVRTDVAVHHAVGDVGGHPLELGGGMGFQYLTPRPLPYGQYGVAIYSLDATLDAHWRNLELGIEGFNLLDRRYPAIELNYPSNWDPNGVPSRIPERHISAAAPFTLLVTLGVHL
jgi:iron complex outermembrane receptor protein